jgi:NAD+ synthase (glutamine-hydrolysing)
MSGLNPQLTEALETFRTKRNFVVADWVDKKCKMLNEYMKKCGLENCVVSVSGGVDSAVTLALLKHAQKMEVSPIKRVVGIAQPIHSTAKIQDRAYELCRAFDAECVTIDQTSLHSQLTEIVQKNTGLKGTAFADGQLRSYMRTPVNFYVAQLLGKCIVLGTGNLDEDGYLLYFCKAGDGVADIQLIADIHKSEVFTVGYYLNVPKSILVAAPSADLWDGQTDEDEMGVTYDFVELYTEWKKMAENQRKAFLSSLSTESAAFFKEKGDLIEAIHKRNSHKLVYPLNLDIYDNSQLELKVAKL